MRPWLHKIEVIVDKLIPSLLVLLIAIIVIEFGFKEFAEKYPLVIEILDGFIIFVFVLDLIFKYLRIRNIPKFLRASWIDILAIFPFFLVFRLVEGIIGVITAGETITSTQKVVHVFVETEKELSGIIKEGEVITKEVSRADKLARFVRPIARMFRFSKVGDKEVRKETEKQAGEVVKESEKGERFIIKETKKGTKVLVKDTKEVIKEVEDEAKKVPRHVKAALFYEKPKIMKHINEKFNKLNKKIK